MASHPIMSNVQSEQLGSRRLTNCESKGNYQRIFSVGCAGLLFFVSGIIGWDLSHSHGLFRGTKWVDGPVWWQIGLGAALVLLAVFWARRVPMPTAKS
jgi:hypothetical protein